MFIVRVWDPVICQWAMVGSRDEEETAKQFGRTLWRRGAAGMLIYELIHPGCQRRIVVEVMR